MNKPRFLNMDISVVPGRKKVSVILTIGGYANTTITLIQGLVLIPLYIKYIGAHTYGLWLASGGILGMLALANFGISSLMVQKVANSYGKGDLKKAGSFFFHGFIVYILICILLFFLGTSVSYWLGRWFDISGQEEALLVSCFQLMLVVFVAETLNECFRSFAQAVLRPLVPMVCMVVFRLVGVAGVIYLLLRGYGLWAIPSGMLLGASLLLIANIVYAFLLFIQLRASIKLDPTIFRLYLKTSPSLFLAKTGNQVSHEAEPLVITMLMTPEITTAYMIVRRAADIVFQLVNVVVGANLATFAHLVGEGDIKKTSIVALDLFMLVFFLSLVGFSVYIFGNQAFVDLWVGSLEGMSDLIILTIGIGFFFRTIRNVEWQLLNSLGDFIFTSWVVFFDGVLRIILSIVLVEHYGVIGVPLALGIAMLPGLITLCIRLIKFGIFQSDFSDSLIRGFFSVFLLLGSAYWMSLNSGFGKNWSEFIVSIIGISVVLSVVFFILNVYIYKRLYFRIVKNKLT